MNMKKCLYLIMAAALVLGACEKEEAAVDNSSISLSADVIEAAAEGDVYEVKVTSSSDWRVSGYCAWARPLAESGKSGDVLKIEVDPNESYDVLTAEFKVFAGSAVESLSVVSSPSGSVFELVSSEEVSCTTESVNISVSVLSTGSEEIDYEFSNGGSEWITFKDAVEFSGKKILIFTVSENETYFERDSEIKLVCGESAPLTVSVHQNKVEYYEFSTDNVVFEGMGSGTQTSEIYSNIEFTLAPQESWLTVDVQKGDMREDGLYVYTVTYSFGESSSTRVSNIGFTVNGQNVNTFSFMQKDPDAVLVEITDRYLRNDLAKRGWILSYGDYSSQCEVLEKGLTETELMLSFEYELSVIDGLGSFPELNLLSMTTVPHLRTLDLSDCHKISTLRISSCNDLENVILGDNPLSAFELNNNNYLTSESLTISSDNLTTISINSIDSWDIDYDKCATLDVTGCPKLSVLKAKRQGEDWWSGELTQPLKTILVSQAQKDAIDAGSLTVDKSDITEIVVK